MSSDQDKYKGKFWGQNSSSKSKNNLRSSRRGSYWKRSSENKSKNPYYYSSAFNILLEDVMIASEKDIVPPDSAIFWKGFYASIFFIIILSILVTLSAVFFWRRLQVTTQSIDQPTYEWFKNNQNRSLLCPCRNTQTRLGFFIKMHVNTWDACFAYMYMIQSMEEARQANLETAPEYAHVAEGCSNAQQFALQDLDLMSDSFMDSIYALTDKQLKTRIDILINRTKNVREQAYKISHQQIKQLIALDQRNGFKNDVRLYNLARKGCNNESKICMVTNPKGTLLDESQFFVEGSNRSCCYYDYNCIIKNNNMTQMCLDILNDDYSYMGPEMSQLLRFSGFCTRLIMHPERSMVELPLRCSSFNTIENYKTHSLRMIIELYIQRPTQKITSKTFGEAFSKGELANVEYSVDNEKYFTNCNPNKCTYFVSDSFARLIQSLALTFAILSPILQGFKILTVQMFKSIPDRYFSRKIDRIRSLSVELASTENNSNFQAEDERVDNSNLKPITWNPLYMNDLDRSRGRGRGRSGGRGRRRGRGRGGITRTMSQDRGISRGNSKFRI